MRIVPNALGLVNLLTGFQLLNLVLPLIATYRTVSVEMLAGIQIVHYRTSSLSVPLNSIRASFFAY